MQKRLQGLKDDTTISFHALAEGVDQLQVRSKRDNTDCTSTADSTAADNYTFH